MMRDSTEERARKRRRTKVGGEVPADSDTFLTPAVQKVRDRAAKRQVAKERVGQTTSSTKARAQRGATRWVGRPSRVGQTTGPSPVGQTAELAGNPAANPWAMLEHTDILLPKNSDTDLYDLFSRRRFYVLRSVAELAERATRKRVPPSRRVMVLPTLRPTHIERGLQGSVVPHLWGILDQFSVATGRYCEWEAAQGHSFSRHQHKKDIDDVLF